MKVVVTGASGQIGMRVCALLAAEAHEPVGVVRTAEAAGRVRSTGAAARLAALEPQMLAEAFSGAHAVVHLAQVGRQVSGQTFEHVNVSGTRAVVAAARAASVRRVVYFSGLGVASYGLEPHCTNAYFLSKLACELELFRSGLEVAVFRPSYVLGPGGSFLDGLVRELRAGRVQRVGDGAYRLQPIGIADAAAAVLAALERPASGMPRVYDLVGPEAVRFNEWLSRLAAAVGVGRYDVSETPVAAALARARAEGTLEDLDCLLCDAVSDPRPLEALLGRVLAPLDLALRQALHSQS